MFSTASLKTFYHLQLLSHDPRSATSDRAFLMENVAFIFVIAFTQVMLQHHSLLHKVASKRHLLPEKPSIYTFRSWPADE
jgi:hypothetical protein